MSAIIPEEYFFRHTLGNVPNLNLLIRVEIEGLWFLQNDPNLLFILDGVNAPEIQGENTQTLIVTMTNDINNYDEGFYEMKLRVFSADGMTEETTTFYVIVAANNADVVMPKKLHFEAVRNVREASSQRIYIASPDSGVLFSPPPFLQMVSHELIGGGHIYELKPVNQNLTPLKNYTGNVGVQLLGATTLQNVRVTYKINAGYDDSFTKPVHFTSDNDELIFYKTTPHNSFLKLLIELKSFKASGDVFRDILLDLDFPFVTDFAKINIGKEIESYFDSSAVFRQHSKWVGDYPPMELRITAVEIDSTDYSVLNQDILPLQYFLKGRHPMTSKSHKTFWMAKRPSASRIVSRNALISLAVFKPAGKEMFPVRINKNNNFLKNIYPQSQTFGLMRPYYYSLNVDLKELNLVPGDEVTFEVDEIDLMRSFIIRPSVKISTSIAFLTEWNTYETVEFTGAVKFPVEYSHDVFEHINNYTEILKKINSKNRQKLIINTGWIHKSDILLFDELILSDQAFLLPERNKPIRSIDHYEAEENSQIELIPVQKTPVEIDTETNSYQFDVEFIINPSYENRIYSR